MAPMSEENTDQNKPYDDNDKLNYYNKSVKFHIFIVIGINI